MDHLSGSLLAFLGISALVIATPGPDTAVTIRNSPAGGRAAGLATAAGVATGQAIWAFATSAGITLHVRLMSGDDTQHVLDSIFKALGVALAQACRPRR